MTAGDVGLELLENLTQFTNLFSSESVLAYIHLLFFGAKLFGLTKSNGDLHCIAVGYTLQWFTTKVCHLSSVSNSLSMEFYPILLGVCTRLGCETTIYATTYFASLLPLSPPKSSSN